MRKTFWCSLLILTLMSMPAAAESAREAIEKGSGAWTGAFNAGDAAGIAALYSENGKLLPPDATQVEGRQAIQNTFQGWIDDGYTNISFDLLEIEESGELAYEVGNFSVDYPVENGQTATATGNYLVVWKREGDGVWRMYRDTWNDSPPPAE